MHFVLCSNFSDIFDVDYFIKALAGDVPVIKKLPKALKQEPKVIKQFRSWSYVKYYEEDIARLWKSYKVLLASSFIQIFSVFCYLRLYHQDWCDSGLLEPLESCRFPIKLNLLWMISQFKFHQYLILCAGYQSCKIGFTSCKQWPPTRHSKAEVSCALWCASICTSYWSVREGILSLLTSMPISGQYIRLRVQRTLPWRFCVGLDWWEETSTKNPSVSMMGVQGLLEDGEASGECS